ncbi:hypothetical protein OHA37_00875 [Streptomyces sp. NBC_00335]|uniref:hypothetical protein n=1 Tax=unclassified Streptomyces TaxID=2593676 RepID=UPI00224E64FF|nr:MULTISPECIES: hypothetical protein [unclassified Streptomyces]MCX5402439.1 hypothetical protein [Streptomyces sp. NBC_00086]
MNSSEPQAVQLYEITYLGAVPDTRTVEASGVAAVIEHAGEHGMKILVRPHAPAQDEPDTRIGGQPS